MGFDRFVYWNKLRPTRAEIGTTLACYLSGAASEVYWAQDEERWYAVLRGLPCSPFAMDSDPLVREISRRSDESERIFEVFLHDDPDDERPSIDVITRQCDEYTSVVADGFASLCARRWNGQREMP